MLVGHYALALAAKKAAPKTSLGMLIAASAFVVLIWPLFLARGLERVAIEPGNTAFTPLNFVYYPISHSLLMTVLWSVFFGLLYFRIRRYRTGAIVLGLLVISHWFLDAIVHRPDLPLTPWSSELIGLGLWNSVPATLAVELAMFAAGVWIYTRTTQARNAVGSWAFMGFVAFTLAIYFANAFGPPPPSVNAIILGGVGVQLFFIALAAWLDRNRRLRGATQP